jgi:hypothetical protein
LVENNPNLRVIGISPDINLVKVWSVREIREVSMQDLLQVLNSETKDPPAKSVSAEDAFLKALQKKKNEVILG